MEQVRENTCRPADRRAIRGLPDRRQHGAEQALCESPEAQCHVRDRGRPSDSVAVSAGEFQKEPRQVGRSGSPCANSIHTPGPTGGVDKMPNGGTAAPTRCPPRRSPQAFGRMSAPALPRFVPGPVPHPAGSPARCCRTPSSHWPRRRASPKGRGSPQPPGGTVHWRCGPPGHPDKVQVARRPAVPKGRLDNHRWAPCSCYTPAAPVVLTALSRGRAWRTGNPLL
jgi:hypothetical protein